VTQWFERFVRRAFLAPFSQQGQALDHMQRQVARMRDQLYQLYEEIELAVRALDLLGERCDAARQRVALRTELTGEAPASPPALVPRTFTADDRQRPKKETQCL
jgi:hypothetical protein